LGRQSGFISWRLSLAMSESLNCWMAPSCLPALSRIVQHSNRMTLNFWGRKLRRNKCHHLVSFLEKCGFCHVSIAAPRLCISGCPDILGKSNHSRPGPQTSKIIRTGPDYEPWVAVNDRIQAVCEHFKRMDWDCGTVICWSEFKNRSSESKSQPISSQWGGQNRGAKFKIFVTCSITTLIREFLEISVRFCRRWLQSLYRSANLSPCSSGRLVRRFHPMNLITVQKQSPIADLWFADCLSVMRDCWAEFPSVWSDWPWYEMKESTFWLVEKHLFPAEINLSMSLQPRWHAIEVPRICVDQQSSEMDVQLYANKEYPLPTDAARQNLNRETQGNPWVKQCIFTGISPFREKNSGISDTELHMTARPELCKPKTSVEIRKWRSLRTISPSGVENCRSAFHYQDWDNLIRDSRFHNAFLIMQIETLQDDILLAISEFGMIPALHGWACRKMKGRYLKLALRYSHRFLGMQKVGTRPKTGIRIAWWKCNKILTNSPVQTISVLSNKMACAVRKNVRPSAQQSESSFQNFGMRMRICEQSNFHMKDPNFSVSSSTCQPLRFSSRWAKLWAVLARDSVIYAQEMPMGGAGSDKKWLRQAHHWLWQAIYLCSLLPAFPECNYCSSQDMCQTVPPRLRAFGFLLFLITYYFAMIIWSFRWALPAVLCNLLANRS